MIRSVSRTVIIKFDVLHSKTMRWKSQMILVDLRSLTLYLGQIEAVPIIERKYRVSRKIHQNMLYKTEISVPYIHVNDAQRDRERDHIPMLYNVSLIDAIMLNILVTFFFWYSCICIHKKWNKNGNPNVLQINDKWNEMANRIFVVHKNWRRAFLVFIE